MDFFRTLGELHNELVFAYIKVKEFRLNHCFSLHPSEK